MSPKEEAVKELERILVATEEMFFFLDATEIKPDFSNVALRCASKIFASVLMDKLYELQTKEEMPLDDKCKMATKCGEDIRQLIKTYTNLDSYDFYK